MFEMAVECPVRSAYVSTISTSTSFFSQLDICYGYQVDDAMMSYNTIQKKIVFFGYPIRLVINKNATNKEIHDCVWQSARRLIMKEHVLKYDNAHIYEKDYENKRKVESENDRRENSSDDNDTKNIDINNKRNFENGKKEGEKDVEDEVVEKPYQVMVGSSYGSKVRIELHLYTSPFPFYLCRIGIKKF